MYFRPRGFFAPKDLLNYLALKTFVLSVIVVESNGCVFQRQLIEYTHTLEIHRCRTDMEFRNTIHDALFMHIYITIKYQNT
jgi:hypothetical protein